MSRDTNAFEMGGTQTTSNAIYPMVVRERKSACSDNQRVRTNMHSEKARRMKDIVEHCANDTSNIWPQG